jgi:hypothetical protein
MTVDERLRQDLITRLRAADVPALRELAAAIGSPAAPPCWGGIAALTGRLVVSESDRLALSRILVELGDARCLLLHLTLQRGQAAVLRFLLERAGSLPSVVHCALVVMPEVEPLLTPALATTLHPAARRLREVSPERREVERQFYAGLQQTLLAQIAPAAPPPGSSNKPPNANAIR